MDIAVSVPGDRSDASGWPDPTLQRSYAPAYLVKLPRNDRVLLGNLTSPKTATARVDAVISLCRVGTGQVPSHPGHHEVRLIDLPEPHRNPTLRFVLTDTAAALAPLRAASAPYEEDNADENRPRSPPFMGRPRTAVSADGPFVHPDPKTSAERRPMKGSIGRHVRARRRPQVRAAASAPACRGKASTRGADHRRERRWDTDLQLADDREPESPNHLCPAAPTSDA